MSEVKDVYLTILYHCQYHNYKKNRPRKKLKQ